MSVICVLCLIVVPLPPGKNPFAVKITITTTTTTTTMLFFETTFLTLS
jgi:hypothetical protein